MQLWLELDAFLRAIATRSGKQMPVPSQLLSLLPPPPRAGWPPEFALDMYTLGLRERAAAQRATDMFNPSDDPEPYVPWSDLWPAWRCTRQL